MINTLPQNSTISVSFQSIFKYVSLPDSYLCHYGFTKRSGVSGREVLLSCLNSIFMAPNLYRFFKYTNIGKSGDVSYDAAMRLMRNDRCNWQGMLLKLSTFCCSFISTLKTDNINCLVADDSMIERPRGKKVELLSRQFNHVSGRHVKGFANLS